MTNHEIAALFDELAERLQAAGENPFKVRAYRNAARVIAGHGQPMTELVTQGRDLTKLPGIGAAIAKKIQAIAETGELRQLEALKQPQKR